MKTATKKNAMPVILSRVESGEPKKEVTLQCPIFAVDLIDGNTLNEARDTEGLYRLKRAADAAYMLAVKSQRLKASLLTVFKNSGSHSAEMFEDFAMLIEAIEASDSAADELYTLEGDLKTLVDSL